MFWKKKDEPDFINEHGYKWWHVPEIESYCSQQSGILPPISNCSVWYVEREQERDYVIIMNNEIVKTTKLIEDVYSYIDVLRAIKMFDDGEKHKGVK